MSLEYWTAREHVIPASHIRGYSRGTKDNGTAHLQLAVKQYIPKDQMEPSPNAITIIMAHGVGSSKESYEPLFDELLHCNLPIRAVWAMDIAHHGASYLLNEDVMGDDHHWFDSSRDMFQMINHFQEQMPAPIVAMGQSWGCVTISMLAVWHPRLFSALVSMEPVFGQNYPPAIVKATHRTAHRLVNRRDTWPSREVARKHLLANPYYGNFDPRVFERVMRYDLRDVPASSEKDARSSPAVTLTTPKTLETCLMLRPDPPLSGYPETSDYRTKTAQDTIIPGFFRGERTYFSHQLQYLLPPVFYLWGTLSGYPNTDYSKQILNQTGTGIGGSGGVVSGKVAQALIEGSHHPIPLEKPAEAAKAIAPWLKQQIHTWEEEAERRAKEPPFAIKSFHPEWLERISKL
ncbi:MAG: hypothetical protein LQ350_005407 [Teloschistes chrysophthalmus]|nr:MAG: hypothetical protein LQ350_005407 [Niorma chrysophthalma]